MKRPRILGCVAAVVLGAAGAVVVIARADPRAFPDPSQISPSGLIAQTTEPATGFTGACLVDFKTYEPTLPLVCYSPSRMMATGDAAADAGSAGATYGAGFTTVTFPAKSVFRPYLSGPANYDSYQVLLTCYPHTPAGACPQSSFAVSRSCCDYGTNLTSIDGQTASGLANFL
jgi:hypothetical protein